MGADELRAAAQKASRTVTAKAAADAEQIKAQYAIGHDAEDPAVHILQVVMRVPEGVTETETRAAFANTLVDVAARVENGDE